MEKWKILLQICTDENKHTLNISFMHTPSKGEGKEINEALSDFKAQSFFPAF